MLVNDTEVHVIPTYQKSAYPEASYAPPTKRPSAAGLELPFFRTTDSGEGDIFDTKYSSVDSEKSVSSTGITSRLFLFVCGSVLHVHSDKKLCVTFK